MSHRGSLVRILNICHAACTLVLAFVRIYCHIGQPFVVIPLPTNFGLAICKGVSIGLSVTATSVLDQRKLAEDLFPRLLMYLSMRQS